MLPDHYDMLALARDLPPEALLVVGVILLTLALTAWVMLDVEDDPNE